MTDQIHTPTAALTAAAIGAGARRRPLVALYTESGEPSGMGAHMLALADEVGRGVDVAFMLHEPRSGGSEPVRALAESARRRGHEVNVLPAGQAAWRTLSSWMRARRPDLLHVHAGIGWEALAAPGLARRAGVTAVLRTEHLPWLLTDPEQQADYHAMLADVDARVCVSEAARQSYDVREPAPISVVQNGVPEVRRAQRSRAATRSALGVDARAPVALTVARFTPQKAYDVLLEAAQTVLARAPEMVFLWVGDGVLKPFFEAQVREAGLERSVRLLGSRDDVAELMAAADVFVLPSRFEGLPLALLEAMQAGLPVVATRAPGTEEVFDHDEAAELVKPEDAEGLGWAILRVTRDPDLADELIDRGGRLVRGRFSARRMGEETLGLYRRLLNIKPARAAAVLQ